jgi:hypoxanthine phosphoribosyltransferase
MDTADFSNDDKVLLVDDVTNTGNTLRAARAVITQRGCSQLKVAALFRDTVDADDASQVDFLGPIVDAWVSFPWER